MDKTCGECRATSRRLRKGRCDACYMRLYRNGEPDACARCAACGERRRPLLTMAEMNDTPCVLCGNCALVLTRARPRIDNIAALAARIDRERRRTPERRLGPLPVEHERRIASRRRNDRPAFDPSID